MDDYDGLEDGEDESYEENRPGDGDHLDDDYDQEDEYQSDMQG